MASFCSLHALAQDVTVKGRIVDASGEPLPYVTIYQDGKTTNGTTSDGDGHYSINVPSSATLVYAFLGFNDSREKVEGRTIINVTMTEEALSIEEAAVVSVGYGTVARRDLTGSVSKVDMDEIVKKPVTNFDQAIKGKVAGVVVTTSDGAVGSEASITIRGNNSLTQSSAPLYVIDGFPSESSLATLINPADIETIDILKDASATAIYGARGANGVIVITTRQGMEGKPKINFSASWTGSFISNKADIMDGYEFVQLQDEIYAAQHKENPYTKPLMEGDTIVKEYTIDDYQGLGTDWQDQIYRPSLTQNYNLSISGGSTKADNRYNISLSALDQDGIIVNSNFQRYQGKINFHQKIAKVIDFDLIANYSRAVTSGTNPTDAHSTSSASGWLLYSVWGYRPVKPLYLGQAEDSLVEDIIDSDLADPNDYRFNPAKTVRNEYRKRIVDYFNANASLGWEIIEGLKLKISGTYTTNSSRKEEFNGSQTYTGYPGSSSGKGINGGIYWNKKSSWLNENILTWTKRFQYKHNLQLMAGVTFQGETADYHGTRAEHIASETLGLKGMHTGKYLTVVPYQHDWRMMSGLFRLNYNYKYKYYLTASFRADGSSKFPKGNRWGYFPSAGLSYNFNREDALKDLPWLSNGKIRASWGLTGNNRTSTPYDYYYRLSAIPGDQGSFDYVIDNKNTPGYFPINLGNEELKWETTEQWNVGLDMGFFDNRIKFTADWYYKTTRDLLLMATMPASSGFTSAMRNIGSMRNQGFEFTLDLVPVQIRNFTWNLNFNIAMNRNKVLSLNDNQKSLMTLVSWENKFNTQYPYITQVGKPSGLMYGYIYEGTYKDEDFIGGTVLKDGVAHLSQYNRSVIRPGDPKYKDINGDGIVDDNDRTIIGCGQPLHTGGFSNSFSFFGFDLNIFMTWSYGNDVLNANRLIFESAEKPNLNLLRSYKNHWTPENPNSDIPRVTANGTQVYSSRVIEDASFLRINNISIGYTLPRPVLRKMHFDNLRIYLSFDNIATFSKYSGPDPEVNTRKSVLTPGFDWSAYPRAFGVTGGLSFTF